MSTIEAVANPVRNHDDALLQVARGLISRALGFRDCLPCTQLALIEGGSIRRYAKGEPLGRKGDNFSRICLIIAGSVELSVSRRDGHRHLIHFLQTGDFSSFGNLLDDRGLSSDMIARSTDTAALHIPSELFTRLRPLDANLGRALELQLAHRNRLLFERLSADNTMPLEARLARLLVTLSEYYGLKRAESVILSAKISQADLADWLGVSRQRINLALKQLKLENLISQAYSSITIIDISRLQLRADH